MSNLDDIVKIVKLVLSRTVARLPANMRSRTLDVVPATAHGGWCASIDGWAAEADQIVASLAKEIGPAYRISHSQALARGYYDRPLADFVHYLSRIVQAKTGHDDTAPRASGRTSNGVAPSMPMPGIAFEAGRAATADFSPRQSRKAQAKLTYRVWFATNRRSVVVGNTPKGFSGDRGDRVIYGHCDVFVPTSHKIGSIGSSALRRLVTWDDDRLKLMAIEEDAVASFWTSIAGQLGMEAAGKRHAVVFVHGYNVSFEQAALRAAQIGYDLGVAAMAFFSWPSRGTTGGYVADGTSIDASEEAIANFLEDFAKRSRAEAVHVIAHSMGNRGVMRAVERLAEQNHKRFGQFVLAAADVDAELFKDKAAAYAKIAKGATLYISSKDRALEFSGFIAHFPRIGLYPPVGLVPGLDTVSVSNIDLSRLGHGYVAEQRVVLTDMHQLLFQGLPPAERAHLAVQRTDRDEIYWAMKA